MDGPIAAVTNRESDSNEQCRDAGYSEFYDICQWQMGLRCARTLKRPEGRAPGRWQIALAAAVACGVLEFVGGGCIIFQTLVIRFHLAILASLCVLVMTGGGRCAGAPDPKWFARDWQTDAGLPDVGVTGVAQTADGYLWVSTYAGLTRFDGEHFTPWALPIASDRFNSRIRTMLLGQNDTLWLAIEGQEKLLLGFSSQKTNIIQVPSYVPLVMAQTPDQTVWIGYAEGYVYGFNITNGTVEPSRFGPREGLSGRGGCWVVTDTEGRLWYAKAGVVGTIEAGQVKPRFECKEKTIRIAAARQGGIWIWDGPHLLKSSDGKISTLLGELPVSGVGVEPLALYEDSSAGLWLGLKAGGLFHWNGRAFQLVPTSHNRINCITEDREGNIWVGTDGAGLNRLRRRVVELQSREQGLPFETAGSVCADDAGGIWAAGANGMLARQVAGRWQTVTNLPDWPKSQVNCVLGDGRGGIWIGMQRGGLLNWHDGEFRHLDPQQGWSNSVIRALFVDSRHDLWIGSESPYSLQRLHDGSFETLPLPAGSRRIDAIAEDSEGAIWLGTLGGFLLRVQDNLVSDCTTNVLQPTRPIRALGSTPDGGLWIGYAGGGLGWLRQGGFAQFGLDQGLPDDSICGIAQDQHGALWFSGSRGLFKVTPQDFADAAAKSDGKLSPTKFGPNDGVANINGSYGSWPNSVRGSDGRLWFATRSGLLVVSPDYIQTNRLPPVVLIESFLVDGKLQAQPGNGRNMVLPPGHRKLEVQAVALNYAAPEGVRFRYRIKGWNDTWSDPGKSSGFTASRLPAGRYEFQVMACNDAGLWNEAEAKLKFEVAPFLWQRWWFRLATLGLFSAMIIGIVRFVSFRRLRAKLLRLEQEASVQRDRARIAQDLHDDLGSRCTEISFLAGLPEYTELDRSQMQTRFSNIVERTRRMTQSLDEIVWAVNPANDTLKATANYICSRAQEYLRAGEVRCRLAVDDHLPDFPLSSEVRHDLLLAVTEAVTNVMKHAAASEVSLHFQVEGGKLIVRVEDNGKGFDPALPQGDRNGLTNMRRRCEKLGGECLIDSSAGKGTAVTFMLPLPQLRSRMSFQ